MDVEVIPVAELHEDPANVRVHPSKNIEAIRASLARFGQQKPILIDASNVVRAGNGTLQAARSLGWHSLRCVRTGLQGPEIEAYSVSDNRTAELAAWDRERLFERLSELELEGIGFDAADVEALGLDLALERDLAGLFAESEPEENHRAKINEGRLAKVTVVLCVPDIGTIERALRKAGTHNRGEAFLAVCKAYLGEE